MKRTLFIPGILFLAVLSTTGCNDSVAFSTNYDVALVAHYIHPDRTDFSFNSSEAVTVDFNVYATETPWILTGYPDWVKFSPSSGNTSQSVRMSLEENRKAESRASLFSLISSSSDWDYSTNMTVSQGAAVAYAQPDQTYCDFPAGGGTLRIPVKTNTDLSINGGDYWVHASFSDGVLTITADENANTQVARVAEIQLLQYGYANVLSTITLNQQMANVTVATTPLSFDVSGGAYQIEVNSDVSWYLTTDYSWIDVRAEEGGTTGSAGTKKFIVEAAPNPLYETRQGTAYLNLNDEIHYAQISVTQSGITLQLEGGETQVEVSALAAATRITVESNISWSTSNWPSWAHPNVTSGSGTVTITVTCDENNTPDSRSQTIRITPDITGAEPKDIILRQRSYTFNQDQTYLEFSDLAQTLTYQVQTDASWSTGVPSEYSSWLSVSPYSGTGFYDVAVSVTDNTSYDARSGQVFTYALGNEYPVNVYQRSWEDKWHVVSEMMEVKAEGGSAVISISTNDRWYATLDEEPDWLTVTGMESKVGDGEITLTFQENNSVNARGVNLCIYFEHSDEYTLIPVRQNGRKIYLNCSSLFFFAKGGSSTVIVTPDGAFTAEVKEGTGWISLSRGEDNTVTVTVTENTTDAVREGIIRMALTDLPNSDESYALDVHVIQTTVAAGFIRNGWDTDVDMNTYSEIGVVVTGFSEDTSWCQSETYTGSINITGFDETSNWNSPSWDASILISGFLEDVDLTHLTEYTGIDGEGYNDEDENWD